MVLGKRRGTFGLSVEGVLTDEINESHAKVRLNTKYIFRRIIVPPRVISGHD